MVVTATITKETHDSGRVCLTNIGGTVLQERDFPWDAEIAWLETVIMLDCQLSWKVVTSRSDDGSQLEKTWLLRDHDRLTCHGERIELEARNSFAI